MQERYIDTPQALLDLCQDLADAPAIMLDTEFLREKTYRPRLCLIQLAAGDLAACVDPLAIEDLRPLLDLLYDRNIVKVMHAARQDLEILYGLRGSLPGPIFDTQIAAALAGFADQAGYATLVQDLLGVTLDKAHTRTDWCARPLSKAQIRYALDDVRYLGPVYEKLLGELTRSGRLDWLEGDFLALESPDLYEVPLDQAWKRLRAAQRLRGAQLAIVRDLAAWREEQARQLDRPRRWILSDDALVDLARIAPRDRKAMGRIRGIDERLSGKYGETLLEIIARARDSPPESWPDVTQRDRPSLQEEALADALMAVLRLAAGEHRVSPQSLASRRELEAIAHGVRDLPVLQGWRRTLVGQDLIDLAEGRVRLGRHAANLSLWPVE